MVTSSSKYKSYSSFNENTVKNAGNYAFEMDDSSIDASKSTLLSSPSIHDRGEIPESHKIIADDYMIVKKVYGYPVVAGRLNPQEAQFLSKYNFNSLELCTAKQMEEELFLLRKWKIEGAKVVQDISDKIIQIRCKELKIIMARSYKNNHNVDCLGYKTFENYLESISKYCKER